MRFRYSYIYQGLFLLVALSIAFVTVSVHAETQFKIGLAVWSGYPENVRGFKDGLAEAGLVEKSNITFLQGESGADRALQRRVAEQFKSDKVDLVYSLTTPGTTIIKEVIPLETPIVYSIVTYPADSGLIESFEYSGNNLVGTSNYVALNYYVQLLQDILPSARKVAIFHRKGEPNSMIQSANLTRQFIRAGLEVLDRQAVDIAELTAMARDLINEVDAFITTTDTLIQSGGEQALIEISLQHNIPILSSNKAGIENGATFGPVADFYILGKLAGALAARILQDGKRPTELESGIQKPPLFLVNRNSLEQLEIQLPEHVERNITWVE